MLSTTGVNSLSVRTMAMTNVFGRGIIPFLDLGPGRPASWSGA